MEPCFAQKPGIAWDEFGGEAVLVDAATGKVWQLNAAGSVIWKLCREGASPQAIVRALAAEGLPESQAREEVERFFAELQHHNLVERRAPAEVEPARPAGFKLPYVAPCIVVEEELGRPPRPVSPNSTSGLPP